MACDQKDGARNCAARSCRGEMMMMDGSLFPDLAPERRPVSPDACVAPIGRRRALPRRSARRPRAPRPSVATLVTLLSEIRGLVHTELGIIRLDLRRVENAVGAQQKVQSYNTESIAALLRHTSAIARSLELLETPRPAHLTRRRPLS
jgi:hypothetical protein